MFVVRYLEHKKIYAKVFIFMNAMFVVVVVHVQNKRETYSDDLLGIS